ncbi:MAG: fibrinogen-like YCDxxxxGGGW domain-containing protein [Deltaproteobacteria bacterium]|nr:fibrinogen-like YCDxxxxGGGW domain-containing protein [Myxococcales bacterium]MDP3212852.1 fibrinogen-like YCDxxxxGGGW domain-containing protein [Deltaproteobacteria bacterium]
MKRVQRACVLAMALSMGCGARAGGNFGFDAGSGDGTVAPPDTGSEDAGSADVAPTPDEPATTEDLGVPPLDVPAVPGDGGVRACRSSRECSDLVLVCDPVRGVCVECVGRNDCASGQSCVDNLCRAMTCVPDSATCVDSRSSRRCLADGVTEVVVPCGARETCGASGRCVALLCEPGVASCDPAGVRRVCNPDGLGYTASPCPPLPGAPTSRCMAGSCQPICEAGRGDCDGSLVTGCETPIDSSLSHCGRCGATCGTRCVAGVCMGAAPAVSCRAIRMANPSSPSGVYPIDPDGAGPTAPFMAWCDMTLVGGGWTLAAIITNADTVHWSPRLPIWVDATTLGDATNPASNLDAKSEAYNSLPADELLIVRQASTPVVEVQSIVGCLTNRTLRSVMQRNSSGGASCAMACSIVSIPPAPWSGGSCQAPGLRFRCRDTASTTSVGGFLVSSDDNSMITTSRVDGTSTCDAANFGLGSSTVSPSVADYDSDPSGTVSNVDRVARLIYLR